MSRNADPAAITIEPPPLVRFDSVVLPASALRPASEPISFDLAAGAFAFLTGPAGAGKTEVLDLIALAARPRYGRVEMFGRDVERVKRAERPGARRRIGVIFQDLRLIDDLTVTANVALAARAVGKRRADYADQVAQVLTWVGLGERLNAPTAALTAAGRRRLALARAVINTPDLLIADEPTGGLESRSGFAIFRLLAELNQAGTTILVATRDETLAEGSGARVIRLPTTGGEALS